MYTNLVCRALTSRCVYRSYNFVSLCKPSITSHLHSNPRLQRHNLWTPHSSSGLHSAVPGALASVVESLPGVGAQMLLGRADAYEGFIVSADGLPSTSDEFDSRLQQSLQVAACMQQRPCRHSCSKPESDIATAPVHVGLAEFWEERHLDQHPCGKVTADPCGCPARLYISSCRKGLCHADTVAANNRRHSTPQRLSPSMPAHVAK